MPRLLIPLALAGISAALVFVTVSFGSFVAGGSDSSCYVLQAERWASGRLLVPDPLALQADWPDAERSFAPAGHFPAPCVPVHFAGRFNNAQAKPARESIEKPAASHPAWA